MSNYKSRLSIYSLFLLPIPLNLPAVKTPFTFDRSFSSSTWMARFSLCRDISPPEYPFKPNVGVVWVDPRPLEVDWSEASGRGFAGLRAFCSSTINRSFSRSVNCSNAGRSSFYVCEREIGEIGWSGLVLIRKKEQSIIIILLLLSFIIFIFILNLLNLLNVWFDHRHSLPSIEKRYQTNWSSAVFAHEEPR